MAVAAGRDHSCAVRTDNTVVCWGRDDHGQTDTPRGSFTHIAAASTYSCAIRANGTIACWGRPLHQRTPSGVSHLAIEAVETAPPVEPPVPSNPQACRLPGPSGFPLPRGSVPSTGTARVAALFVDFPDIEATGSTAEEAALGLPFIRDYLKAASQGKFDVEFVPLHRWLRAEHDHVHYLETSIVGTPSLERVPGEAVRLADPEVNFAEYDSVMVIMSGTHFGGGFAMNRSVPSRDGPIRNMFAVNTFPTSQPQNAFPWGHLGAHELVHGLGDLYPYDGTVHEHPEPPEGKMWASTVFGLMSMWVFFPVSEGDPRLGHVWRPAGGDRYVSYDYGLEAQEMLAWSRWQLGWLEPDQIHCLTALETEVTMTLSPIARPGSGTAMIAIPVSRREAIVIENRRKLSYDAGVEFAHANGTRTSFPSLAEEGVLVYTVNAALAGGKLPLKVAGDSGNAHFDDYPMLTTGESVTIRVQSTDDHTVTITIQK